MELEAEVRGKRGIRGLASYAFQRATNDDLNVPLTNSPRHMAKFQLSVPGPIADRSPRWGPQYLSRRLTLSGATVAPHVVVNVTVSAPIGRSLDLPGSRDPQRPGSALLRTRPRTSTCPTRSNRTDARPRSACDGRWGRR